MPFHDYAGQQVEVTDEGFFVNRNDWTPGMAQAIAREAGIAELTPTHWTVISFCREDAASQGGRAPGLRRISKLSGVDTKALYALFPKGPGKLAALIAGLPKPEGCI